MEVILDKWKPGLLIYVPITGNHCGNWRGIIPLSVSSKIQTRIILERLKTALDAMLRNEQPGFRSGRSCVDQIATLRIIVEESIEWQSTLHIAFVDFSKAFDSVDKEGLWRLLWHYGVPTKVVNFIKGTYNNFRAQVELYTKTSCQIHLKVELKYGKDV